VVPAIVLQGNAGSRSRMPTPAMQNYHLLPSVRGDFPARLGRHTEARAEFERAASLTRSERERTRCWTAPPPAIS
jgi:predicted RNA polymerase sigma factor